MSARRPLLTGLACLIALLLGASVSATQNALISQDPPDAVRFCVQKDSLQVRLVPEDESCRATERLVLVSIEGPAGPEGPPGPGLETGSIAGRLTADCSVYAAADSEVHLPGHSFSAKSDNSGGFVLHWVPAGSYKLRVPLARPHPIEQDVAVLSGLRTEVGEIKVQSVLTDVTNCGTCGTYCGMTEVCREGACGCAETTPVRCEPTPWRPYGMCLPAGSICEACPPGRVSCNGACVDLVSDPQNCGACGVACAPGGTCLGAMCMNPPPPMCPPETPFQCANGMCVIGPGLCMP